MGPHIPLEFTKITQTTRNRHAQRDANVKMPNATYIAPARVGGCVGNYRLALGSPGFALSMPGFLDANIILCYSRLFSM